MRSLIWWKPRSRKPWLMAPMVQISTHLTVARRVQQWQEADTMACVHEVEEERAASRAG